MLKKRILASSMASVMALSSVSLVAFADEKDFGEAVTTKADLQKYIDSLEDFMNDNLDKYGKTQPANFSAAVDHAKVVIADVNATSKDYAAAYAMVKAVKAKLKAWSNDELKALVKEWQGVYDTNNILNEELNDNIYSTDTFEPFREAFEQAERYIDSGDEGGITDAYVELDEKAGALKKLTAITKSDFRTALANYEQLELSMRNYESWRRGTISVVPKTGPADNKKAAKIVDKKAIVTVAELRDMVYGTSTGTFEFLEGGEWDNTTLVFNAGAELIGADWDGRTSDLKADIKKVGDDFAALKGVVSTTDPTIKAAYDAAVEAVDVYNSWTADSYRSGSKSGCSTLEKKYHNQLVETYNDTDIKAMISSFDGTADAEATGVAIGTSTHEITGVTFTYTKSTHKLVADKDFYIVKNKATGLIDATVGSLSITANFYGTKDAAVAAIGSDTSKTYQKVAKKTDILQFLGYEWSNSTALDTALDDYDTYLNTVFTGATANTTDAETIMGINGAAGLADGKTLTKVTGGTTEWTLIWRQLAYALEDAYPVPVAETATTLKMLEALVKDAYTLCDETGDAEIFSGAYADVVASRQAANTFIKVAKATTGYKDGDALDDTDLLAEYNAAASVSESDVTVAMMYDELKADYDELNKWYKDFKYSFDKVKTDLADAAIALKNGDLAGDALAKAVEQCAYDLSIVEVSDVNDAILAATNVAFEDDRTFQGINRLKTGETITNHQTATAKEKALVKSYEALVKAVAEAAKGDADKGYDLTADGNVDFEDVQFLFDNFVMKGEYNAKYDFNNDKIVDFEDVQIFFDKYVMA